LLPAPLRFSHLRKRQEGRRADPLPHLYPLQGSVVDEARKFVDGLDLDLLDVQLVGPGGLENCPIFSATVTDLLPVIEPRAG
jgi:hypothetical protein